MTEELSGIELRQAVAAALGWTKASYRHRGLWAFVPIGDLIKKRVPEYEHDLDAVFEDVVGYAHEKGYRFLLEYSVSAGMISRIGAGLRRNTCLWTASFFQGPGLPPTRGWARSSYDVEAEDAATAICRAFVALETDKEGQEP